MKFLIVRILILLSFFYNLTTIKAALRPSVGLMTKSIFSRGAQPLAGQLSSSEVTCRFVPNQSEASADGYYYRDNQNRYYASSVPSPIESRSRRTSDDHSRRAYNQNEEKDSVCKKVMGKYFLKLLLGISAYAGMNLVAAEELSEDSSQDTKHLVTMNEKHKEDFSRYIIFLSQYVLDHQETPSGYLNPEIKEQESLKRWLHEYDLFAQNAIFDQQLDDHFFSQEVRYYLSELGIDALQLQADFMRGGFCFVRQDLDYCLFDYKQNLIAGSGEQYVWEADLKIMHILRYFPSLEPLIVRYLCKDLERIIKNMANPDLFVAPNFFLGYMKDFSEESRLFIIKAILSSTPEDRVEEYRRQLIASLDHATVVLLADEF